MADYQTRLRELEPRLRLLLPADLYVGMWVNPNRDTLTATHDHLRTLYRILFDHIPRHVAEAGAPPGEISYGWQDGTLMFTDLAGFTPLLEAFSVYGQAGATDLLGILNDYFSTIIEIVGKSGGLLLEFTGDAILVQFPSNEYQDATQQAVNCGLRMQRSMSQFVDIQTPKGLLSLGMRIGIHRGHYLAATIGTPRRMEQVLLGTDVRETKLAEGGGHVGRVNLTPKAYAGVQDDFDFEPGDDDYMLVVDNFTEEELGDYELSAFNARRLPSALIMDRSEEGLTQAVEDILVKVEPLASYLPIPILNFLVENASRGVLPPAFSRAAVIFVNLMGLSETVDEVDEGTVSDVVEQFSGVFALINAAVEARGGVLKHVTYHLSGADMLIYFGLPNAHADDPTRAADAAHAIREIVAETPSPYDPDRRLSTKIGINFGEIFAAEVGETRGRREWNILGDTVNTAARLMGIAEPGQILMTESVYHEIWRDFECDPLRRIPLKGKSRAIPVFSLIEHIEE